MISCLRNVPYVSLKGDLLTNWQLKMIVSHGISMNRYDFVLFFVYIEWNANICLFVYHIMSSLICNRSSKKKQQTVLMNQFG